MEKKMKKVFDRYVDRVCGLCCGFVLLCVFLLASDFHAPNIVLSVLPLLMLTLAVLMFVSARRYFSMVWLASAILCVLVLP